MLVGGILLDAVHFVYGYVPRVTRRVADGKARRRMGAQVLRAEAGGALVEDDLVAIKVDVSALRADVANIQENLADLRADVKELRGQTYAGFVQLRGEMRADLSQLRGEMRADLSQLRGETNGGFSQLRADMDAGFSELRADVKDCDRRRDRDFRILFGALITIALGLSGLMAKGFGWIH